MKDESHFGESGRALRPVPLFITGPSEGFPALAPAAAEDKYARAKQDTRPMLLRSRWRWRVGLAVAVVWVASAGMIGTVQAQLPSPETAGGVEYVTGGFGSDMSTAFKQAQSDYPLALTFAAADEDGGSRPYIAEVRVVIRDKEGGVVMEVPSAGPYFLARLSPGSYTVEATYMGETQTREVAVKEGGSAQEVVTWRRP